MTNKEILLKEDNLCFVISPIGDSGTPTRSRSDLVLNQIIEPAAKRVGLQVLRSDTDRRPGLITSQIIRHLLNAKVVVADLTDHNANVFYELALRHAFRKPVIQLILKGQPIPFDAHGLRTIEYLLPADASSPEKISGILKTIQEAQDEVAEQIRAAISPDFEVESTVTIAAKLEDLTRSKTPESPSLQIMETILEQIGSLTKLINNMSKAVCKPEDLKDAVPPLIQNQIEKILKEYSDEVAVVKSVRQAGLRDIFKRRAVALQTFSTALDEETESIMVIGSSLKGLLQREEYKLVADKLNFKNNYIQVRFLLTHPIIADLRAKQEGRAPGEIGREIITSLKILKDWNIKSTNVKLYLGTPTCFAIKTNRSMLIDPYPYMSTSYDSPCFIFDRSFGGDPTHLGYFYDEFSSRHFGAWETELSVSISNYDQAISLFTNHLRNLGSGSEILLNHNLTNSLLPCNNINELLQKAKVVAK